MLETIIRDYLVNNLAVPVVLEKPANKPDEYVVLHKIDGGMTNKIPAGTLSVTCVSKTLYGAATLAQEVKDLLFMSVSLDNISSAKLGGEDGRTSPTERGYEYEIIFNFYYFEEV